MDSFTQRMMVRATSRRVEFEHHLNEILTVEEDLDDPDLEGMLEAKKKEYREILRGGVGGRDGVAGDKENSRELTKVRVTEDGASSFKDGRYPEQRSRRFAHLATQINNWEDESDKKLNVAPRGEAPPMKPVPKPISSPAIQKKLDRYDGKPAKKVAWDHKVLQNLEMQGFQRCDSEQHLVFDYRSPQKAPADCSRASSPPKLSPAKRVVESPSTTRESRWRSPSKHPPVQTGGATFRSASSVKFFSGSPTKAETVATALMLDTLPVKQTTSPKKTVLDRAATLKPETSPTKPETVATLPVKQTTPKKTVLDRAAKFESETSPSRKVKDPTELSIQDRMAIFERNNGKAVLPKAPFGTPVPPKDLWSDPKPAPKVTNVVRSVIDKPHDSGRRGREENELQGGPSSQVLTSPNRIRMGTGSPVQRSPERSPTRSPRKSSELVGNLSQIKKIKISPPKAGRLYPSISDIETDSTMDVTSRSDVHESDFDLPPQVCQPGNGYSSDSDESSASFGRQVVTRARLSQVNLKRGITTSSLLSSSTSSATLDTSAQESRVLHEMDDFLDEALLDASPPKRPKEASPPQPAVQHLEPVDRKLVHTVSTYRKLEAQRTPKQEMFDLSDPTPVTSSTESALVPDRIFELDREMIKQTTIISQATQALNLCHARPEFAGSLEQVEAEKLLLIATSRRAAALRELERLKIEKTLVPGGVKGNVDKGNLTIEYISLPIKMCPKEIDKTDYFMCLVTSGVTVVGTQVLALKKQNLSRGNRLAFTKPLTLENLYCDFTVTLEVYKLNCGNPGGSGPSAEVKEDKKLSSKLRLTPQKKSRHHARLPVESPGGPNSVRSPSFKMVGFVVFSLRELRRNKFTLNKVPYGAPLDGTVELSMTSALNSEVEYRGFLTQFEEVTGFGAWKRKWALLRGSAVTFWLYPEHEEQNKIPIDTVDLGAVRTREVGLVSRDVCARPHTFLLETDSGEKKLFSADTADDRLAWTRALNKSLQLIRAWGGGRPY